MSKFGLLLLTYNREEYARRTLTSALNNVFHSGSTRADMHVHIASDGDTPAYIDGLVQLAYTAPNVTVTVSNAERRGYGANYNLATQRMHQICDYTLVLEDDWELIRPLNVGPIIEDMAALGIGCGRLGYLGYTQELRGHLVSGKHVGHWLVFDPYSPEPHVFAGHPRIEATWWSRNVGLWPEGLAPGHTEFEVAHLIGARRDVAWPLSLVRPEGDMFVHIGTTRSY